MNKHFIAIITLLLLSACCKDGVEKNKYVLTDIERVAIPYTSNQTIQFKHTNGFQFDLVVLSQKTELERSETKHCGDDYVTYEIYKVELRSNIPELYINLEVFPEVIDRFMSVSINRNSNFGLNLTSQPDIDTLKLNGNEFYNVYQADSFWSDTLTIRPKHILYNKEVGIIQITMTDDETFTIDE